MLFAITLQFLVAAITSLTDLAEAVKTDVMPDCSEFCVTGTVSYAFIYQDRLCHVLIENDGVAVNTIGSFENCPQPEPGDRIRLDGTIIPWGAGSIQPEFRKLDIIEQHDAPIPAEGPADVIMSGLYDFRRAHLVGEFRDIEPSGTSPYWNYISIISNGQQYYAPIPTRGAPISKLEAMIGSTVRLDGFPDPHNCSFRFSDERRFVVASLDNITILAPPPDNLFEGAPSVEALHRVPSEVLPRLGRHMAKGHILTIWQSRHALLRMSDGRIANIHFSEPSNLKRGACVEVIGYPSSDGFFLSLSRSIARKATGMTFKESLPLNLSERIVEKSFSANTSDKFTLQGQRVHICGMISDFGDVQRELKTLPLTVGGHILDVDLSSVPESMENIVPGCHVRMMGTCVLSTESWATISTGAQLNGIRLVINHPDDVVITARPPWWTTARLITAIAILVLVIAAILIWNRQLKNLSEKRGKELFRERSASAIAELKTEERTRLAAEIHDSISQILTGAAMQLDAGEIQAAKRILASCRRELRACLWDLRSHALDAENFSDAIKETLVSHMNGRSASIEIDIPSSKMSERLRHAALCIIREAVVNAIRHGRAETIAISGDFDGHNLVFSIVDDGKGFDPATARGSKDGHFGLLGMRERAKAFKGSVTISSSSGNGTEIAVVLEDHDENEQG